MDANANARINWDRLCRNIAENNLIPVLGNEMYIFDGDKGPSGIEQWFAEQLLKKYDVPDAGPKTIAGAVDYLIHEQQVDIRDINDDLKLMGTEDWNYPLLNDFLAIDHLFFYVNTTVYGHILEAKIQQLRNRKVLEGNFSINESFPDCENINNLEFPFVFNIYGSLTDNVAPALKEEEMLEFTTALIGKTSDAKFAPILDALKNKSLLFLGCSHPDWIIRFLFRILSNERIDNWLRRRTEIIIVNNACDQREAQFNFVKYYRAITYPGDTTDFIQELKEKWDAWTKAHPPAPKNIFLSYSHKDKAAAELLFSKLSKIEHVKCWYDNSDLHTGDNFTNEIILHIDAADLFIPLISTNSLGSESTYVKREWLTAFNTNVMRNTKAITKHKYLFPIAIDDANLGDPVISEFFPSLSIAVVKGGDADEQFINSIKKELELI